MTLHGCLATAVTGVLEHYAGTRLYRRPNKSPNASLIQGIDPGHAPDNQCHLNSLALRGSAARTPVHASAPEPRGVTGNYGRKSAWL